MGKLRVLVDLNVVIDVAQNRQPFYDESARTLDAIVRQEADGWLAAHSITTLFYLTTRLRNRETAAAIVTQLLDVFTVAAVDENVIRQALSWGWQDFEDAVQMAAAIQVHADYLVTRNPRDFPRGLLPVIQPAAFLALLAENRADSAP